MLSECLSDWIKIRPEFLMGMLYVQTVWKRYQQMALGDKELSELVCLFWWLNQYSWPSRAWNKNSVGIFEYILASMLKVYLDVF